MFNKCEHIVMKRMINKRPLSIVGKHVESGRYKITIIHDLNYSQLSGNGLSRIGMG